MVLLLTVAMSETVVWAQQGGGPALQTSVGQVGQRQTREDIAPATEPLQRIEDRIENRVQSRVRNRIDRFYDPQANAASPFVVAADRARVTGRAARR